jgi:hypothetical protein
MEVRPQSNFSLKCAFCLSVDIYWLLDTPNVTPNYLLLERLLVKQKADNFEVKLNGINSSTLQKA